MRFTALVVVGDGNGHVGVGLGNPLKFRKQSVREKKTPHENLVSVALDENNSLLHMTSSEVWFFNRSAEESS